MTTKIITMLPHTPIGTIRTNGKTKSILKSIKIINKQKQQIIGLHECWHKWVPSKNNWTKSPTFYIKVV